MIQNAEETSAPREYVPLPAPASPPIIRRDDPRYLPATFAQVAKVLDMVSQLGDQIRTSLPQGPPRDSPAGEPRSEHPLGERSRARFNGLVAQWRSETAFYSSLIEMATHPAYQQIIGMGRLAIPHILRDLSREPDHWFWALKAITGEDPVSEEDRGDLARMTQAWLVWGARNGYEF